MPPSLPHTRFGRTSLVTSLLGALALSVLANHAIAAPATGDRAMVDAQLVPHAQAAPDATVPAVIESEASTAPSIAEESRNVYTYDDKGNASLVSDMVYTVLRDAGRDSLSKLDFSYAEDDTFVIEHARVIAPDGRITDVDKSMIEVQTAPSPEAGYVRQKQTSIVFPALLTGSKIELKTRGAYKARMSTYFHHVSTPVLHNTRVDVYDETVISAKPMQWKSANMDGFTITASPDARELRIHLDAPRFVPVVHPGGTARIHGAPRVEAIDTDHFENLFKVVADGFEEVTASPLPPKAAAFVASLDSVPPAERIASVMAYIQTHYRYFGDWRLTDRGYRPFPLTTIETNGYGDCKDLASLTAAMLRATGFKDAGVALIYRGLAKPDTIMDGPNNLNHAITHVTVNGNPQWLDPTNPVYAAGRTPDDLQERDAYVFEPDGTMRKMWIAASASRRSTLAYTIHPSADGSARYNAAANVPANAFLIEAATMAHYQGSHAVDRELCTQNLGVEPKKCTIQRETLGTILPQSYAINAQYDKRKAFLRAGNTLILDDPQFVPNASDLETSQRAAKQADIYQGELSEQIQTVTIPGVRSTAGDAQCTADSPWRRITTRVTVKNGGVVFEETSAVKTRWISYPDLKSPELDRFLTQTNDCMALLRTPLTLTGEKK